jgi:NADPH:quinone reductase-like Zn-dependent oxidoreductase
LRLYGCVMKAVVFEKFGSSKELKLVQIDPPTPQENEVMISIRYAAVNPVDWKIREGYFGNFMPHEFPIIPGWDGAGVINKVGSKVHKYKVGDEVYAYFRKPLVKWGTYCENSCMGEEFVAPKPKSIGFKEAASLPLVSLTAWQALFDFAGLKSGETLLILGGSGGVGSMAVQFGSYCGAYVMATCSSKNFSYVKSLGAQETIDYTLDGWVSALHSKMPQGFDIVFDCAGGPNFQSSVSLVKKGGRLISIVYPDVEKYNSDTIRAGYVFVAPNSDQLISIGQLIDAKKIQVPEIREMNLLEAAQAQDLVKQGHVRGKVVLKINGEL